MEFKNILSDEELHLLKALAPLAHKLKNKHFAMGRDWDEFVKLTNKLCGLNAVSETPIDGNKVPKVSKEA